MKKIKLSIDIAARGNLGGADELYQQQLQKQTKDKTVI